MVRENNSDSISLCTTRNIRVLDHFRKHRGNLSMAISQQGMTKTQPNHQYLVAPQTFTEAMEYAKLISASSFCPTNFKGKPGDVLMAMQFGAEVGISPMQALQNIAIINGKPCIWGDAALALVQSCPYYISHKEWEEGDINNGTLVAYCAVTRKGSEEYIKSFSQADAIRAGLWKKPGVWQQYPARMLQMRARAFCMRDKFADALRGLSVREEVEDYHVESQVTQSKVIAMTPKPTNTIMQIANDTEIEFNQDDFEEALNDFRNCKTKEELRTVFTAAYKNKRIVCDAKAKNLLVSAKDEKLAELERETFLAEYDNTTVEVAAEAE